jgi:hypothetical protein
MPVYLSDMLIHTFYFKPGEKEMGAAVATAVPHSDPI